MLNLPRTIAIAALTLSACVGVPDDHSQKDKRNLSRLSLNITDARGLFLTGDNSTAARASFGVTAAWSTSSEKPSSLDAHSIYKVTDDGYLLKVTPTDGDGNSLPEEIIQPLQMAQLSDRFLWLQFRLPDAPPGLWPSNYLVDTRTGRAYLEVAEYQTDTIRALGSLEHHMDRPVQTDDAGNLYLACESASFTGGMANWAGFCKIDTSKIETGGDVAVEELTRDVAGEPMVSGDGRFFVYRHGENEHRLRPVGAPGYAVLPGYLWPENARIPVVKGLDGKIYTVKQTTYQDETTTKTTLYRIDLGEDLQTGGPGVEVEDLGDWEGAWRAGHTKVVGGKLLVDYTTELDIDARQGFDRSEMLMDGFKSLFAIDGETGNYLANDRFVFLFGISTEDTRLVKRWEPATGETVTFDQLGQTYDIEKIRIIGGGDAIWFEAVRRADETRLIGELAADGTVTEIGTISAEIRNVELLIPVN
jgi:hypothetical protein